MELKDVKTILTRIKVNYPTFVNDAYTQSEWYKELKDYSLEDVMNKLEQHFRSETYGNSIPKVYFLTKYLTKEKNKNKFADYEIICPFCQESINCEEYDEHYGRCSSIDFLIKNSEKYFDKKLNKEKLKEADEEVFEKYYWNFCEKLLENIHDNISLQKSLENSLLAYKNRELKYEVNELLI